MAQSRAFAISLSISILFHLSMVTVFSIVIFFPREAIRYYSFQLVQPQGQRPAARARAERLRVPSLADAPTAGVLGTTDSDEQDIWSSLPQIELPTLEFAELRRLRGREKGLALRARHEAILEPKPRDTWARFGEELDQLGHALSRLTLSGGDVPEEEALSAPVSRPAAGFEAYVEWTTGRTDRQLLFAPPIEALWGVDPDSLGRPIVIEFTVNAQGRVVSVWSPQVDDNGLVTAAQNTLLKYRFEPVSGDQPQQATLHITAARARP